MIAIIDYGVGNLFSLTCSLTAIGAEAAAVTSPEAVRSASKIILPGVGAFGDAAALLRKNRMDKLIIQAVESGTPLLGICLGMQLLFDYSLEYGRHEGLGLIHGSIQPIQNVIPPDCKVPHIGWNALQFPAGRPVSPLFQYISEVDFVYFVHSFSGMDCGESVIATSEYGVPLTAAVARENVFGVQFHPEKSGEVGLRILKAFCAL